MAIGTVSGTTYTPGTSTGLRDDLMSGMKAPFMSTNQVADQKTTIFTAVTFGLVGLLIAKMLSD